MKYNLSILNISKRFVSFCSSPFRRLLELKERAVLFCVAALLLANACRGSLVTYTWNCDSASSGPGSDPNLTVGDFTRVNGGGAAMIDNSSASSGYDGASGGNNFQAISTGGEFSPNSSAYFAVTLTPDVGYVITLTSFSLGSRSTGTGPTALAIYSSIDNYAFSIGSASVSPDSSWVRSNHPFSGNSLEGPSGGGVTLRIYGYGGSGATSSYNWRIDDISFTVGLASVPESDQVGLLAGVGLLAFCGFELWRQRCALLAR